MPRSPATLWQARMRYPKRRGRRPAARLLALPAGSRKPTLYMNPVGSFACPRRSRLAVLLFMLWLSVPATCAANRTCPWLNAATASGVLEGPVVASVTDSDRNKDDATCEFIRREGSVVVGLRIEVETMKDPTRDFAPFTAQCGLDAAPIKAIGNEATVCSRHGKKGQLSEQVVSRVRDRAFVVRVSSNASGAAASTLRAAAQRVAEQVAGFLF
jgi:hypothetical protein